jgi:hypothetical protein
MVENAHVCPSCGNGYWPCAIKIIAFKGLPLIVAAGTSLLIAILKIRDSGLIPEVVVALNEQV